MIRRFDREDGKGKIHMQSVCAMQHFDFNDILSYSYEQLFETMRILGLHYPDAEQFTFSKLFQALTVNNNIHY